MRVFREHLYRKECRYILRISVQKNAGILWKVWFPVDAGKRNFKRSRRTDQIQKLVVDRSKTTCSRPTWSESNGKWVTIISMWVNNRCFKEEKRERETAARSSNRNDESVFETFVFRVFGVNIVVISLAIYFSSATDCRTNKWESAKITFRRKNRPLDTKVAV